MGIRVIKTALAAVAAIYVATLLQLTFPLSAGLLAVLGVDVTRKKSLHSAFVRIASAVVGLLFAILLFSILGFRIWVVGLFICSVYPVLAKVRLKDGIVTSTVIMIHVYTIGSTSAEVVLNEVFLLLVGLGMATIVNLAYMPSWERELRRTRTRAEASLSAVFREIAKHLRDPGYIWSGSELIDAERAIEEGAGYAGRSLENALFQREDEWWTYFTMRRRQLETIQRMLVLIARVYEELPYGQMTADLFDELSEDVKNEFYTGAVETRLQKLEETFRAMPLPATRREFETRAAILQICLDLEHYLSIAKEMKKKQVAKEGL
ncbi:aromatic acid exporter family protein [Paenibacillus sp. TRM 82003]|nr:aromatic acid exporter family protein [Paenibacillus sp. TRM 82003]